MPKTPQRVYAAIALIERRGRLLICRRPAHVRFGGYWEFPGGKRRGRETWATCVRREVREELGIGLLAVRPEQTLTHRSSQCRYELKVFHARLGPGVPRPLAAQALRWVAARALWRYRFPPANQPLIAALSHRRQAFK